MSDCVRRTALTRWPLTARGLRLVYWTALGEWAAAGCKTRGVLRQARYPFLCFNMSNPTDVSFKSGEEYLTPPSFSTASYNIYFVIYKYIYTGYIPFDTNANAFVRKSSAWCLTPCPRELNRYQTCVKPGSNIKGCR